jgi:hypothetical protein
MGEKPVYVIDAANFDTFAGFVEECNRVFIRSFTGEWHGSLDAFNDYLWWGEGEYVIVWKGAEKSRRELGHPAMAGWLTANADRCHPSNVPGVLRRREQALAGQGPTLFDTLVEIIREQEQVELRLE